MSATSIGQIGLDLVVNKNQFESQMAGITGLAKKTGAALTAAFGIKKLVDFGKQCLELGSDLASGVYCTFCSCPQKGHFTFNLSIFNHLQGLPCA